MTSPNQPQFQQPAPQQPQYQQPVGQQPAGQQPVGQQPQYQQYQQPAANANGGDGFFASMNKLIFSVSNHPVNLAGLIGIIGGLLGAIGTFLPFISAKNGIVSVSISLLGGEESTVEGWIIMIASLFGLAAGLIHNKGYEIGGIICGAVAFLLPIPVWVECNNSADEVGVGSISVQIGFWFIILGALMIVFASVVQLMMLNKGIAQVTYRFGYAGKMDAALVQQVSQIRQPAQAQQTPQTQQPAQAQQAPQYQQPAQTQQSAQAQQAPQAQQPNRQ